MTADPLIWTPDELEEAPDSADPKTTYNRDIRGIKAMLGARAEVISANRVLTTDYHGFDFFVDASTGNVTITLPASLLGLHFNFVRTDASTNTINIVAANGGLVATQSSFALGGKGAYVQLRGNGVDYYQFARGTSG